MTKIVGFKDCEDDDNFLEWWRKRISIARGMFLKMGFIPIEERCLSRIFRFSFKIKPKSKHDSDMIISNALNCRNLDWVRTKMSMQNLETTRHVQGRPLTQWIDCFVKFRGQKWYKEIFTDLDAWKSLDAEFIKFCLRYRKCKKMDEKKATEFKMMKEPRPYDGNGRDVDWAPLNGWKFAIEFCGDSLSVVNWVNGVWPCLNPNYDSTIGWVQNMLCKLTKSRVARQFIEC